MTREGELLEALLAAKKLLDHKSLAPSIGEVEFFEDDHTREKIDKVINKFIGQK